MFSSVAPRVWGGSGACCSDWVSESGFASSFAGSSCSGMQNNPPPFLPALTSAIVPIDLGSMLTISRQSNVFRRMRSVSSASSREIITTIPSSMVYVAFFVPSRRSRALASVTSFRLMERGSSCGNESSNADSSRNILIPIVSSKYSSMSLHGVSSNSNEVACSSAFSAFKFRVVASER